MLTKKEQAVERACLWVKAHPDKTKEYQRVYGENHLVEHRIASKKYRENPMNKEKIKVVQRLWNKANPEKEKAKYKKYRESHPDKVREFSRESSKRARSTDRGRLICNVKTKICKSLKGSKKSRHWEDIVGYTIDQLKKHLEKQFKSGMTWENYGTYWHVDHKIPIAAFNFEKPEDIDFKRCWSLKNLQPLWSEENIKKGAKLNKPFQPALAVCITCADTCHDEEKL